MSLSRKSIFLNLFWSSAGFVTSTVRTILLIPVFLSNWDSVTYGYWLLIFNFYSISIYIIEGYSRYTINEYSKLYFKDPDEAYSYFGSGLKFLVAFLAVCIALLSVVLSFSSPVAGLFNVGEAAVSYHKLQYCILLVFMLVGVHSICKYLGYAIAPHGKIYVPERFLTVYVLAESALWVIAALGYLSIITFFVLYFVVLSLISILFVYVLSRNHSFYKSIFSGGSLRSGWGKAARSLSFIVNNFCEKFTVEGLTFIVSALFSAVMVPLYHNTRTMGNFLVTGTNMITATFTIEYQKHSANRNGQALFNLFNGTWLLVGFIINYGLIIFYQFFPRLFMIWTQNKHVFNELFFDCVLATSVFIVYGSNIITYLKSVNRLKRVFTVSITRAVLLLTFILVFPKELEYIGLSLLLSEFIVNVVLLNFMLYKELSEMSSSLVVSKVFWNVLPFLVTAAYVLTCRYVDIDIYAKMLITLIVITVAYGVQIKKLDNEALVVRLQAIKHKVLNLFR